MQTITRNSPVFSITLPDSDYQRAFDAEVDVVSENELRVRGQMKDHRFALEHSWTLRTPDYEILEASAWQTAGDEAEFSTALCQRYAEIKGVRIGRGFTKRIRAVLGELPGAQEHLFLAIEIARAGQQVYQFPPEFEGQYPALSGLTGEVALRSWQQDRAYMADLANSCYTYRDESEELFRARAVRCGFDSSLTRPEPGAKRVFWRNKRLSVRAASAGSFSCESAMEDLVHDIQVSFELAADGTISQAQSRGLRLPYHGVCEDAQQRTPGLNGLQVSADYVRQFAEHVGGASGCTHLFDLSMDVLRLFRFGG